MKRAAQFLALAGLLAPQTMQAGRPLTVDDADPVAAGLAEIEMGVGHVSDESVQHWDFPVALAFGICERLEFGVGTGGQTEEREELASGDPQESGISDVLLGTKWRFMDEKKRWPAQSLSLGLKLPTANRDRGLGSGEMDFDVTWIASKRLGEKTRMHFNAGYSWLGDPPGEKIPDTIHYGVALGRQVSQRMELVCEVFADSPLTRQNTSIVLNGGVRWQMLDRLTVDAAVGTGLNGAAPGFVTAVGLTWTIDFKR